MKNYESHLTIKSWAEEDRPREKLLIQGKHSLSNAELIAILIGSGSKNESAVELSKKILNSVESNLIELSKLAVKELCKFSGIGEAKAISIIAALELGKRRRFSDILNKQKIGSSKDAFEILQTYISDKDYEEFWIVLLDRSTHIKKIARISEGGVDSTVADPKKIFKVALDFNASSIILSHNHPSGNIKPSMNDIKLTKKLVEAGKLLDIQILDHIIVGDENYYSFADENLL